MLTLIGTSGYSLVVSCYVNVTHNNLELVHASVTSTVVPSVRAQLLFAM